MTVSNNYNTLNNGLHIYTAGVAMQEFFIICFLALVFTFQRRLSREEPDPLRIKGAKELLLVLYVSLGLISVCNFPSFSIPYHLLQTTNIMEVSNSIPHHRILRWCRYSFDRPI